MKNFKKITGIALAGCMALSSLMMTAGAADVSVNSTIATSSGSAAVDPRAVLPSVDVPLNEGQSSQLIPWSVYSGYGHWKIMVKNLSKDTIKVKIRKGSPTGAQIGDTMVVGPMQQLSFYCNENTTLSTGAYYLDVGTSGNYNLKGNVYYKFGDSCDSVL